MRMAVNRKPSGGSPRARDGFKSLALPVYAPNGLRRRSAFLALGGRRVTGAATGAAPAGATRPASRVARQRLMADIGISAAVGPRCWKGMPARAGDWGRLSGRIGLRAYGFGA